MRSVVELALVALLWSPIPGFIMGNPDCWVQDYNYYKCCLAEFGPNGNMQCWDSLFNFDHCCFNREVVTRTSKVATCIAGQILRLRPVPAHRFQFEFMLPGTPQHMDRSYTYDIIPPELEGCLLFQGVHCARLGTSLDLEFLVPSIVYFFFHGLVDGGYTEIFPRLEGWKRCSQAPEYDVLNGAHGRNMTMYKRSFELGEVHSIPPTTHDRACFSIVFCADRLSPALTTSTSRCSEEFPEEGGLINR